MYAAKELGFNGQLEELSRLDDGMLELHKKHYPDAKADVYNKLRELITDKIPLQTIYQIDEKKECEDTHYCLLHAFLLKRYAYCIKNKGEKMAESKLFFTFVLNLRQNLALATLFIAKSLFHIMEERGDIPKNVRDRIAAKLNQSNNN